MKNDSDFYVLFATINIMICCIIAYSSQFQSLNIRNLLLLLAISYSIIAGACGFLALIFLRGGDPK